MGVLYPWGRSVTPRVAHGATVTPEQVKEAQEAVANAAAGVAAGFAVAAPAPLQNFDFLFPELQNDPDKLLKTGRLTVKRLRELGRRMHDPEEGEPDPGNTGDPGPPRIPAVPALYTYFGQFVDHDITFEQTSLTLDKLLAGTLEPLSLATIRNDLKNTRMVSLELDSVYGGAAVRDPRDRNRMKLGTVSEVGGRPPGKAPTTTCPAQGPTMPPRSATPATTRT